MHAGDGPCFFVHASVCVTPKIGEHYNHQRQASKQTKSTSDGAAHTRTPAQARSRTTQHTHNSNTTSYGRMGEAATELLPRLGASAEDTGSCSMRAFIESALRELSVALCRGNSRIVRAYTAVVARVAGKALLPSLPVASADAADTDSL
jgi:hypothetical protein